MFDQEKNQESKVIIRLITGEDAQDVSQLCCEGMGYHCDRTLVRERIAHLDPEREAVFVAELDGSVVGFIHVEKYNTLYFESMANLLGMAVSSRCRRHGIGKLLIDQAEAWALAHDISIMRLNTGLKRVEAHAFYSRLGYRNEKEQYRFSKRLDGSY